MIIGLTGNMGSGKSTVAKIFELLGCAVFYSDEVAKEVYFEEDVKPKIIELLGKEVYQTDGSLDKNLISNKIFSNTNLLQALNAIIHPAVIRRFKHFIELHPNQLILKETALLFEARLTTEVDKIIVVAANIDLRVKRVAERDGLSEELILKKMKSQLPQEDKIKQAHFVIYNNEQEFLTVQVLNLFKQLQHA